VWIADIGAYFAGRAFGRHKLAPQISPGKTWEGALGATLALVSYGLLVLDFRGLLAGFGAGAMLWLVLGLVALTAVSICGDLFESLLKRQAGVKDSGQLLPGHGGVLDRIDSLTSTLPWVGIVFLLWRS
jgi:phosphatidate cytidylyltransferase